MRLLLSLLVSAHLWGGEYTKCPKNATDSAAAALVTPMPFTGGPQTLSSSRASTQIAANGAWPFMNTYIRAANVLDLIEGSWVFPQFQAFAHSKLSVADADRMGTVMTAMHRAVNVKTVDQKTADRTPAALVRPHTIDIDGLQNFFTVQRNATIRSLVLYAQEVGWKEPKLGPEIEAKLKDEAHINAYFAELFWSDPRYTAQRETFRNVLVAFRGTMESKEGMALSLRYREAFKATANLDHTTNGRFQKELRDLVRDQMKKANSSVTDKEFDQVWNSIRDRRLDWTTGSDPLPVPPPLVPD
jgi:hypothetical protein